MGYAELIEKLRALPADKRAEVFDFVEFLSSRTATEAARPAKGDWKDDDFSAFALAQAMRGQEDDPVSYSTTDLKERWR